MMNCDRVSLQADFEQVGVFGGGEKQTDADGKNPALRCSNSRMKDQHCRVESFSSRVIPIAMVHERNQDRGGRAAPGATE